MKLRALLLAAAVVVGSTVALTGSAQAATAPQCTTSGVITAGNGWSAAVPLQRTRTGAQYAGSCYLRVGDYSDGIGVLQQHLAYCYGADLAGSGTYGSKTKAAVARVQRLHGLTVDGVFGPKTFKAMKWREQKTVNGRTVYTSGCYRPFASRSFPAAPGPGAYSPYCSAASGRYAGNGWWADLPSVFTPPDRFHFACYLKLGDRTGSVRRLQEALRYCHRASIAVDGYYGTQTKAAVARVQKAHGITVDGVYGPATMKAMYWRLWNRTTASISSGCYSPF